MDNRRDDDVKQVQPEDVMSPGGEQNEQKHIAEDRARRPRESKEDHSEREGGGDQDIDTAGTVPGNKATSNSDPVDF